MPFSATSAELAEFCSQVGPVREFRVIVDSVTNRSRGCGFCEYYDAESAAKALRICLLIPSTSSCVRALATLMLMVLLM